MIEAFRMISTQSRLENSDISPLRLSDFDAANSAMNESYLSMITNDRMGEELLLESAGLSPENLQLINEGVIGMLLDSARKLFKTIIDFIKNLINKINFFADTMSKNINAWMKKVAPKALANSKEIKYVKDLTYEGYNWNEAYIGSELMGKMKNIMAIKVKRKVYKAEGDNVAVVEEVTDSSIPTATKFIINTNKYLDMLKATVARNKRIKDADDAEKKEKEAEKTKVAASADDKNKDPEAKEFKVDIPDVEGAGDKDGSDKNAKGVSNRDVFKEAIDQYLKKEFDATKTDYTDKIAKAAKRSDAPVNKNRFSASIIQRYVNFIASSPTIVNAIHERYSGLLDEYNKLYDAINNMDDNNIAEGDSEVLSRYKKYIKQPVYETLGFIRDCTAINNTISKLNISLVEECTKEYMKICNKLALMKGGGD